MRPTNTTQISKNRGPRLLERTVGSVLLFALLLFFGGGDAFASSPRWTIPEAMGPPLTHDGSFALEGHRVAPPFSWHARLGVSYRYDVGLADRGAIAKGEINAGFGFPGDLELALSFPVGWTTLSGSENFGSTEEGFGPGDLRVGLLWGLSDASEDVLGVLLGATLGVPTGDHEKLLGEGGFSAEPFVSLAFQLLSTRLGLNLAYRFRPEHVAEVGTGRFEQDDEVVWRAGLRVPKTFDAAWFVQAGGAIGVLTRDGGWPDRRSRPIWLGAGFDFPLTRALRLGLLGGFGVVGESVPDVFVAIELNRLPVAVDEDKDGIRGSLDVCPMMAEDLDGFEDDDGCPDLDNDKDGFPDDEDECPNIPATDDFSENGC